MVYIYTKKVGSKKYYILRKSFRIGEKVYTKDIKYIGCNLSRLKKEIKTGKLIKKSKKTIEIINFEKALKNIKKNDEYYNIDQISKIKAVLNSYNNLSKKKLRILAENFNENFIVANLLMEPYGLGYLNVQKIRNIIKNKEVSGKVSLNQIKGIINTKNTFNYLENKKGLDLNLILFIYESISNKIVRETGFRIKDIKIQKSTLNPSKAKNIKKDLKILLSWYNIQKNKIHPLALAILFHHKFEKIHPFFGLNGEIGRILMNYILEQSGYPPIIIPVSKKEEYHKVMNKAYPCLKNDLLNTDIKYYGDLMKFMHKQFVKTYWDNFVI